MAARRGRQRQGHGGRPPGTGGKPRKPAQKAEESTAATRIPPSLLRSLRREAHAFGLSTADYLRLVIAVSAAIRQGIGGLGKSGEIDGSGLLQWVKHPLFGTIVAWLSKAMAEQLQGIGGKNAGQSAQAGNGDGDQPAVQSGRTASPPQTAEPLPEAPAANGHSANSAPPPQNSAAAGAPAQRPTQARPSWGWEWEEFW